VMGDKWLAGVGGRRHAQWRRHIDECAYGSLLQFYIGLVKLKRKL